MQMKSVVFAIPGNAGWLVAHTFLLISVTACVPHLVMQCNLLHARQGVFYVAEKVKR